MAVVVIDLQQNGMARGCGTLHGGDEFAGLPNRYAAIVPTHHAHHSGVFDALPHVLDSIHFEEGKKGVGSY